MRITTLVALGLAGVLVSGCFMTEESAPAPEPVKAPMEKPMSETEQKAPVDPKVLAGGNCCLPAGGTASYTYCMPGGTKCCMPFSAASCTGVGGVYKATAAVCAAAPAGC